MARWLLLAGLSLALGACDDGGAAASDPSDAAVSAVDGAAVEPDAAPVEPDAAAVEPDAAPVEPDAAPAAPDAAPALANTIAGRMHRDGDGSDESVYAAAFDAELDTAIEGAGVTLVGADGERRTTTDAEGRYRFDDLADGTWLAIPDAHDGRCARRNCPRRFAEAVRAGRAKIVTWGDSVPKIGDAPFFPDRLVTLLEDLADVESVNVAVPGSTSDEWLPGGRYFEQRLREDVADADLVLISIGGNDLVAYASNPALLRDIPAAVEGAHALVAEVAHNILTTVGAIREINPTVDVAFCLYVNYTQSRRQQIWVLATRLLGEMNIRGVIEGARRAIPGDSELLLVDLYSASLGLPLDDLLYDPLHFNDAGQTFYAEEVLRALGGVRIGESPLSHGRASYGNDPSWSYAE